MCCFVSVARSRAANRVSSDYSFRASRSTLRGQVITVACTPSPQAAGRQETRSILQFIEAPFWAYLQGFGRSPAVV